MILPIQIKMIRAWVSGQEMLIGKQWGKTYARRLLKAPVTILAWRVITKPGHGPWSITPVAGKPDGRKSYTGWEDSEFLPGREWYKRFKDLLEADHTNGILSKVDHAWDEEILAIARRAASLPD